MKLVKIEDHWINPDAIDEIDVDGENTFIEMRSDNGFDTTWPIEKVLQAIEGSKEHSITSNDGKDIYSKKYITSSNLMVKDDAKMKKLDAKDIKSGTISTNFDSNGTAIINAKKIKLNGVDLQNQAQNDERYLELASHISDLQGQIAELQDKLSKLSN
ncbi:hypothetical protein N6G95_09715 [Pediococcus inopinatus]|uniref:hypothetical protein n=1 Tax=Pediococcus inopinatus TaxID=114090 RepID=UPI002B262055|nr:hypothetical protein [Pediococcus inopinatus]WPC19480.1 hypothetical protein N6G95_09715 [Pediococcus inopinatus]